jgi:hypothetical protein
MSKDESREMSGVSNATEVRGRTFRHLFQYRGCCDDEAIREQRCADSVKI